MTYLGGQLGDLCYSRLDVFIHKVINMLSPAPHIREKIELVLQSNSPDFTQSPLT